MQKQLLKRYCTFTVTAMLFSAISNAQIVYTDVTPDSTMFCGGAICAKNYNLDLNNDGNNDFTLSASASATNTNPTHYGKRVIASPLNGNAVKDILVNSNIVSIPLQFNTVIDSNLLLNQSWQTSGWNILKDTAWSSFGGPGGSGYGLWDSLSDYFLGLRLLQSGQTYYGWVRLRVDVTSSYASVIIIDYAYNSIPNQPILAGQTMTTGIVENTLASSMNLFPNPASDELTTDFTLEEPADVQFGLYDIVGNLIVLASEEKYAAGPNRRSMNVEQVPPGIYLLAIKTNKSVISHKVIVQH